jgi:hypothetical protein
MSTEAIQLPVRTSGAMSDAAHLTHENTHDIDDSELIAPVVC